MSNDKNPKTEVVPQNKLLLIKFFGPTIGLSKFFKVEGTGYKFSVPSS